MNDRKGQDTRMAIFGCLAIIGGLCSADEYTMQYMENNRYEYHMADWERAVAAAQFSIHGWFPSHTFRLPSQNSRLVVEL